MKNIDIINEYENNSIITLTEDSVNNFIFYCQNQNFQISRENVIALNFLSKKYEVQSLINETDMYILEYSNDILLQFLSNISNHFDLNIQKDEEKISQNLNGYLDDSLLLLIPVPFMYRIIKLYLNKNDENLIQFMFKYLEKQGRKASVLFSLINIKSDQIDALNTEYSQIFDSSFINKSILQNILLKRKEKIKETIKLVKEEIDKNKNEIHLKIILVLFILLFFLFLLILSSMFYYFLILPFNDNSIKMMNLLNDSKSEVIELKEKLYKNDNLINKLMKEIDELKHSRINCPYRSDNNPIGIIGFLQDSVTLSGGGKINPNFPLSNIKKNNKDYFYNYYGSESAFCDCKFPKSVNDSWVEFDFGEMNKVDITSYLIRTNEGGQYEYYHSRTWNIVGSNDKKNWFKLDKRKDDQNLNGNYMQHHFVCQNGQYGNISNRYRYIRYVQKDSWCNGVSSPINPYNVYLTYFEFYGDIYIHNTL